MKIKKSSKRQTLKLKYAIDKKSREHRKKTKRLMKSNAFKVQAKKKAPGIPNSWPFKAELLRELQLKKEEERQLKKTYMEKKKNNALSHDNVNFKDNNNLSFSNLAQQAQQANSIFNEATQLSTDNYNCTNKSTTSKFYKQIQELIDTSDVIIEVLDSRDPKGCRNEQIEKTIISQGKKLILLLNKIDLVPKDVIDKWIVYLRQFYPTTYFKATTSKNMHYCKTIPMNTSQLESSSTIVGMNELMSLLKNYSRTESGVKTSMTVGVLGYPNVGKSSVINSLCRNNNATFVGAQPGITRNLQYISLDKKIKIIDSPGIIPIEKTEENVTASLVLRNAVQLSNVKCQTEVIEELIRKVPAEELMHLFKIPFFSTTTEFLQHVAKSRGKLLKKGEVDYNGAAHIVLQDWVSGKIKYYNTPSEPEPMKIDSDASDIKILSSYSEPFQIEI